MVFLLPFFLIGAIGFYKAVLIARLRDFDIMIFGRWGNSDMVEVKNHYQNISDLSLKVLLKKIIYIDRIYTIFYFLFFAFILLYCIGSWIAKS